MTEVSLAAGAASAGAVTGATRNGAVCCSSFATVRTVAGLAAIGFGLAGVRATFTILASSACSSVGSRGVTRTTASAVMAVATGAAGGLARGRHQLANQHGKQTSGKW